MQERTKNNLKEILEVLLSAWENGEDPISDSEIARRMVNRGRKITSKKTKRGKPSLQNTRKEVNNLLSVERSKEYPALFTIEKHGAHNSNLHEITPNGIFWLFCEDGISFKRFLNDFSTLALLGLYDYYEHDLFGWIRETMHLPAWKELPPRAKETIEKHKKAATEAIKKLNTFFENHPEKRTGMLLKKYLRKYDLERYSFSDFELKTVIHNVLYIFGRITMEDYEESLLHDEGYVGIACDFVPERRGDNRLFIAVNNVFEIPESKP